jgi:protein TonB
MKTAVVSRPEMYNARELARASGRSASDIEALLASGRVRVMRGGFVAHHDAVRALRALNAARPVSVPVPIVAARPALFEAQRRTPRETRVPLIASSAVHSIVLGGALLLSLLGRTHPTDAVSAQALLPARMVFLATPGPGGGGGGSGAKKLRPPSPARREGRQQLSSPLPPPPPRPAPVKDPEPEPQPAPAVEAPVASVPADTETRPGVVEESRAEPSQGSGEGGNAGTGAGTGVGAGQGSGIGEGSGGGTGGGPYRPGSGIEPPTLRHEVKPDYSEEARRKSVEGDVVLEIVVRRDGSVGDVRVLHGMGYGLDARAVQAVRQWRFAPARRFGTPVDVLVEVSVEFKLR